MSGTYIPKSIPRMTYVETGSISLGVKNISMPMMFIEHLNTCSCIEHFRYLENFADLAQLCVDMLV